MKANEERFWPKVDKTDGCWLWTAARNRDGYGMFKVDAMRLAHRVAYELLVGPIPAGMDLDHTCHAPACVNPDHLRSTTHRQNLENRQGANANSKSGVRGVFWLRRDKRWVAAVVCDGRNHRRHFIDLDEARAWVIAKRNELFTHNDADRIAS